MADARAAGSAPAGAAAAAAAAVLVSGYATETARLLSAFVEESWEQLDDVDECVPRNGASSPSHARAGSSSLWT